MSASVSAAGGLGVAASEGMSNGRMTVGAGANPLATPGCTKGCADFSACWRRISAGAGSRDILQSTYTNSQYWRSKRMSSCVSTRKPCNRNGVSIQGLSKDETNIPIWISEAGTLLCIGEVYQILQCRFCPARLNRQQRDDLQRQYTEQQNAYQNKQNMATLLLCQQSL